MPWNHDFVTSNLFLYFTESFYAIPLKHILLQIEGFMSSKGPSSVTRLSHVVAQSAFTVQYACIYCSMLLQIMTMVNVTKSRVATGIFGVAHTIHPIIVHLNIRFENTAFLLFFLTLWPLTSVRISVSHAHGCQSPAQEQSWISRWLH